MKSRVGSSYEASDPGRGRLRELTEAGEVGCGSRPGGEKKNGELSFPGEGGSRS